MSNNRNHRRRRARFRNRPSRDDHRALLTDPAAAPTQIRVMAYGPDSFEEHESPTVDQVEALRQKYAVVWVDVAGLANVKLIQEIGTRFNIHPLVMEDLVRTHQRPKLEEYPSALFVVARMAPCIDQEGTEQLGAYLTGNCLLTFQEIPGDDLDGVRNRIRQSRGRIRSQQVDYLLYALIDAVIDAYFPIVDRYGEIVENLEDRLVLSPSRSVLREIYEIRRRLLEMRRAMWPHREMLASLYRGESELISESTTVFLRDCYDHTIQLVDLMENYRELASNLMEVYLSSVSNRLNEIMKVLTIISAVFIPLTFIVGVYGMNFHTDVSPWNMPELTAYYGYPLCWAFMIFISIVQIVYFWRKGWLRSESDPLARRDGEVHAKLEAQAPTPVAAPPPPEASQPVQPPKG